MSKQNNNYWFKCGCKHDFKSDIHNTSGRDGMCPYCLGNVLCRNEKCVQCYENSFMSYIGKTNKNNFKHECFDTIKNKTSTRYVIKNTKKKYWFNCDICNSGFDLSIYNIINNKWCPLLCNEITK
jgi:hypothetical protein